MRLDTMALMRLTLTLFNPPEPTPSSPSTPIIGRVAADREAGADYAGNAESRGGSNKLVTVRPEAWSITWMKSVIIGFENQTRFSEK